MRTAAVSGVLCCYLFMGRGVISMAFPNATLQHSPGADVYPYCSGVVFLCILAGPVGGREKVSAHASRGAQVGRPVSYC